MQALRSDPVAAVPLGVGVCDRGALSYGLVGVEGRTIRSGGLSVYIHGLRNIVLPTVLQGTNPAGGWFQPLESTQSRITEPSAGWAIKNP